MTEPECRMTRDLKILPSLCDGNSLLSIPSALDIFQDSATLHASRFDIGPEGMERRNYFWVLTKMRIHINRMPSMLDDVLPNTWIQAPERASCERDFSVTSGDELLLYGKSMWAVISRDSGRLVPMADLYPELDFCIAPPDDRPFMRLSRKFDDCEEIGRHVVTSTEIDLGGHMNNVNYVRAMLSCFSSDELRSMDISELEINYISQSFEGDELVFVRRDTEEGTEIEAISSEGKAVFAAHITHQ